MSTHAGPVLDHIKRALEQNNESEAFCVLDEALTKSFGEGYEEAEKAMYGADS